MCKLELTGHISLLPFSNLNVNVTQTHTHTTTTQEFDNTVQMTKQEHTLSFCFLPFFSLFFLITDD